MQGGPILHHFGFRVGKSLQSSELLGSNSSSQFITIVLKCMMQWISDIMKFRSGWCDHVKLTKEYRIEPWSTLDRSQIHPGSHRWPWLDAHLPVLNNWPAAGDAAWGDGRQPCKGDGETAPGCGGGTQLWIIGERVLIAGDGALDCGSTVGCVNS